MGCACPSSKWVSYLLASPLEAKLTMDQETALRDEGLYVYMNKTLNNKAADSAGLRLHYWPKGKGTKPVVKILYVDD